MAGVIDFVRRLYQKRQQSDDPVQRRLYEIAEMARTDPVVSAARRVFRDELSVEGQTFDVMFASYWLSLEVSGKDRDWNLEDEPLMKSIGMSDKSLIAARENFTDAVLNRVFLRVALDGLSGSSNDLGRAPGLSVHNPSMFDEIIKNLEAVRDAIKFKNREDALSMLTLVLLNTVDLFGDDESFMARFFPSLETLKEHVQYERFDQAWALAVAMLARFRQASGIVPKGD